MSWYVLLSPTPPPPTDKDPSSELHTHLVLALTLPFQNSQKASSESLTPAPHNQSYTNMTMENSSTVTSLPPSSYTMPSSTLLPAYSVFPRASAVRGNFRASKWTRRSERAFTPSMYSIYYIQKCFTTRTIHKCPSISFS